jgi:hypothetical protein
MRREAMPQRVTARALPNAAPQHGLLHRPLHRRLVEVMPPPLAGLGIDEVAGGRKDPLPFPGARRRWRFPVVRAGKRDRAGSPREITIVQTFHALQVLAHRPVQRGRKDGDPVFVPLATTDHERAAPEVHILHPKGQRFQETHP